MPFTYPLPQGTVVPLQAGHDNDHEDIYACLVTLQVLAPSGDPTGAADYTALAALLAAGQRVAVAAGSYYFSTAIAPPSYSRVAGPSRGQATFTAVGCNLFNIGAAATDTVEIDHLSLTAASGHDLFGGSTVNCVRWHVHHCTLTQSGTSNCIWNGQIPSTTGVMIECAFDHNIYEIGGGTRTVPAWQMTGSSAANAINQNVWRDEYIFNNGADASQYVFSVTATTQTNSGNQWKNIVFEHPYGGMISLQSHSRAWIENCLAWDLSNTVENHLISVSKSSGGGTGLGNTIVNSPRNSSATFGSGAKDIVLDANCPQTMILAPQYAGSGTGLLIDTGGSAGVSLLGLPAAFTLTNGPTTPGRTTLQAADTSANAVLSVASTATAPAQSAVSVENANAAENSLGIRVHGDPNNRLKALSDGSLHWGPGSATQDVNLYRSAANILTTDDGLQIGGTSGPTLGNTMPEDLGYQGWAFDPAVMQATGTALPGSGVFYLVKVPVRVPKSVTGVSYYVTAAGGSLTSGKNFVGVISSTGTLVGGSADQTANFGSTGLMAPALTSGPYTVQPPFAWVVFLFTGTTGPAIGKTYAVGAGLANGQLAASAARYGSYGSGETALAGITPASITMISTQWWAAIY